MNIINLLITDDDNDNIESYKSQIKLFNLKAKKEKHDIEFNAIYAQNLSDAFKHLSSQSIDFAIVDLRLSQNDGIVQSGNDLLRKIKSDFAIPTVVLSGYLGDIDPNFKEETIFFKVKSRTDIEFEVILNSFIDLYKSGIIKIFKAQGLLDEYIKKVFWNHLAKNFELLNDSIKNCNTKPETIFLRYTLNHLMEYLTISDEGTLNRLNSIEMYIIPPIKEQISTGDIFKNNDDQKYFIILTPACDLAQAKTSYLQIAEIDKYNEINDILEAFKRFETGGTIEKFEKSIKKLLTNASNLKYHFLPGICDFPGGLINFQKVNSILKTELEENHTKICSISENFMKDITCRFGSYYSRQGQPDLNNIDKICEHIVETMKE